MNWVAWQMLTGDRAKYWGTIFGVAFGTLLISQQTSLFVGLMRRTASQIADVREATIWVMDPEVQNSDEVRPLAETDVFRVRGVPGVSWAVRYYKGLARAKVADGRFRQVMLMGVDELTLVAPVEMIEGSLADLSRPDAIIVDRAGFDYLWPGQPPRPGRGVGNERSLRRGGRHLQGGRTPDISVGLHALHTGAGIRRRSAIACHSFSPDRWRTRI